MTIKSYQSGFTLVEMLVAMAIFGILMVVGTNFLLLIIKNNNRSIIANEVRQNQSKILGDMISEIRKSACVYSNTNGRNLYLKIADVNSGPNATDCAAEGNRVTYTQNDIGGVWKISTSAAGVSTSYDKISTNNVSVMKCSTSGATCGTSLSSCTPGLEVTAPSPGTQGSIGLTLTVQQLVGSAVRSDYCFSSTLSDTVTPRNF